MNSVMNNTDLLRNIFSYAFAPIPNQCWECGVRTNELHLSKYTEASHTVTFPNGKVFKIPTGGHIPLDTRNTEELVEGMKVDTDYWTRHQYRCSRCWCMRLRGDIGSEIYDLNKKERELIYNNEFLFKKHRLTKTKQKEQLHQNLVYKSLRRRYHTLMKAHKNFATTMRDSFNELVLQKKIVKCKYNSIKWTNEIKIRKIFKFFTEGKIHYKTFLYLSNKFRFDRMPSWDELADDYGGHYRQNSNYPALPDWWKDL